MWVSEVPLSPLLPISQSHEQDQVQGGTLGAELSEEALKL